MRLDHSTLDDSMRLAREVWVLKDLGFLSLFVRKGVLEDNTKLLEVLDMYFEVFDLVFCKGQLRNKLTPFKPDSDSSRSYPFKFDADFPSDGINGRTGCVIVCFSDESGCIVKQTAIKVGIHIFPSPEQDPYTRLCRYVGTLVHECIHARIRLLICYCLLCLQDLWQIWFIGVSGHGYLSQILASKVEKYFLEVFCIELCLEREDDLALEIFRQSWKGNVHFEFEVL